MNVIFSWISSQDKDYYKGLELYNKYKLHKKHDDFLQTKAPTKLHRNILYNCMVKLSRVVNTEASPEPEIVSENKLDLIKINPIDLDEEKPGETPMNLRSNTNYVNKLLALNFSDLSYNDKLIFNNSEKYFLDKKASFVSNSDLSRTITSLHEKLKVMVENGSDVSERKRIINEIDVLDKQRTANWESIDKWENDSDSDNNKAYTHTITVDVAERTIKDQKRIRANKVWIERNEKKISKMKKDTPELKKKYDKKVVELEKRKKELDELALIYNSSK